MDQSFPEHLDASSILTSEQNNSNNQGNLKTPMIATINVESQYRHGQVGSFNERQSMQHLQGQFQPNNHTLQQHSQFSDRVYSAGAFEMQAKQLEGWNLHGQNNEVIGNSNIYGTENLNYSRQGIAEYSHFQDTNGMNSHDSQQVPYSRSLEDQSVPHEAYGVGDFHLTHNLNGNARILLPDDCLLGNQQLSRFDDNNMPANNAYLLQNQMALQYNQKRMAQIQSFQQEQTQQYSIEQILKMRNLNNLDSNLSTEALYNSPPNDHYFAAQYGLYNTTPFNGSDRNSGPMVAPQMETLSRAHFMEQNHGMNQPQNLRFPEQSLQSSSQLIDRNEEGDPDNRQNEILRQMLRSQHEMLRRQKFGGPVISNFPNFNAQFQPGAMQGTARSPPDLDMGGFVSLLGAVSGGERTKQPPRKKKVKAKDKPKRPLSAYNLFFQEERKSMLSQIPNKISSKDLIVASEDQQSSPDSNIDSVRKRKRIVKHGKLGFEEMAKIIGSKWKDIEPERLSRYQEEANKDRERYKKEVETYNIKQQKKESPVQDQRRDNEGSKTLSTQSESNKEPSIL